MEGSTKCGASRLCIPALGMSLGITWGLAVLVLGVLAKAGKIGLLWVSMLSSVYIGFATTPKGIAIGVAWAFAEAFVCGIVIALIYNLIAKCCCKAGTPK